MSAGGRLAQDSVESILKHLILSGTGNSIGERVVHRISVVFSVFACSRRGRHSGVHTELAWVVVSRLCGLCAFGFRDAIGLGSPRCASGLAATDLELLTRSGRNVLEHPEGLAGMSQS